MDAIFRTLPGAVGRQRSGSAGPPKRLRGFLGGCPFLFANHRRTVFGKQSVMREVSDIVGRDKRGAGIDEV